MHVELATQVQKVDWSQGVAPGGWAAFVIGLMVVCMWSRDDEEERVPLVVYWLAKGFGVALIIVGAVLIGATGGWD